MVAPGGACMIAPRGMCGCSRGACMVAPRGVCMVAPWGGAWLLPGVCMVALGGYVWLLGGAWDTTRYGDTVNERVVRILLECILVVDLYVVETVRFILVKFCSKTTVSSVT